MRIRPWFATVTLGCAIAMPAAALTQGAGSSTPQTHKSGQKTATSKGSNKSGKTAGKGGSKGAGAESGDAVTDSWITMKIKTDLTNESTLKGSDISIATKDKVVTLKGTVASEAAKTRAEQIAKATQGVTKVVDDLTVPGK